MQNFTQKDLTKVKIFQKVLDGATFLKHSVGRWLFEIVYIKSIVKSCRTARTYKRLVKSPLRVFGW